MSIKEININGKTAYQVYVFQVSKKNSKRIQRKRVVDTKPEAIKLEKDLAQEITREICRVEGEGILLKELIEKWYSFHTFNQYSHLESETREDYYNAFNNWFSHLFKLPVSKVTRSDIKEVILSAERRDKSRSFQSKLKNMINSVFKWGLDEGIIRDVSDSPARGISLKKVVERKPEILTLKEVEIFLEQAKAQNHPWFHAWALALLTGCRNGELFALEWSDVNLESNKIMISKSYNTRRKEIKSTKAGYFRTVPINSNLRSVLLELSNMNMSERSNFVLPRLNGWNRGEQAKVLRSFLASIGLPSVKFHTLRACFATMLLAQSIPPITVMKVCGWRDLDTMARYIRLAGIDEIGATNKLDILPVTSHDAVLGLASRSVQ